VITIGRVKVFNYEKKIILKDKDNEILEIMTAGQAKSLVERLVTAIEERK